MLNDFVHHSILVVFSQFPIEEFKEPCAFYVLFSDDLVFHCFST